VSAVDALPAGSVVVQQSSQRLLQALAATLGVAFLGLLAIHFMATAPEPPKPVRSFSFSLAGVTAGNGGRISPDGKHILYAAGAAGQTSLWLHSLENESVRELNGTEGAVGGFWSPDSLSIGFGTDYELKRVSIDGGSSITLCGLPYQRGIAFAGGTWSPDGESIVFSSSLRLFEIAARGGEPQMLFGSGDGPRTGSRSPHFLPSDGGPSALIYSATAGDADRWVAVLNLETGERKELAPGFAAVYSPDGHLIHGHSNASQWGLWALPFARKALSVTGEAFPIAGVGQLPSVSRDGALAYWAGAAGAAGGSLVWRNRAGGIIETVGQPQPAMKHPAISPDGQRIAVNTDESGNPDIWVHDLIRSTKTRFTFFAGNESRAIWSPSGEEISFRRGRGGGSSFLTKAADGTGDAVVLVASEASIAHQDWSQDGEYLVYQENANSESRDYDIRYVKFQTNGESSEPLTFLSTPASELVPRLSPDGRFVAYVSSYLADGAEHRDVYVRPFPDGSAGTWQVSLDGGSQPRWRGDGAELYYVKNTAMMAVPVSTETGFTWDRPQQLFESVDLRFGGNSPTYDVSADGQRFLTIKPFFGDETESPKIRVVQNWYEEFREREQD
jgi:Tol biopolymer transport system component